MFKNVPEDTFFPTVWFETKVTVPSLMAEEVLLLTKLPLILAVVGMTLLGLGIGIPVILAVCYFNKEGEEVYGGNVDDQSPILNQSLYSDSQEQQTGTTASAE